MLSDEIESFIKSLLSEGERQVELQRNELAQHFGCAPSQINYVLSTRFTLDHGYIIESRRGGGGYIRIVQVMLTDEGAMLAELIERIGSAISREQAIAILQGLFNQRVIDERTARVMNAAIDAPAIAVPASARDYVRAGILKNMLEALMLCEATEVDES